MKGDFINSRDYFQDLIPVHMNTGDVSLNKLLNGGLLNGLIHLFYGDKNLIIEILLNLCVNFIKESEHINKKVVFVDALNRFNPYKISKLSASKGLSPRGVLERILISRAFTWHQLVEIISERLNQPSLEPGLIIISGITHLIQNFQVETYEDLQKIVNGLKHQLCDKSLYIVLTAGKHPNSRFKPNGGKIISHFAHVLVKIENEKKSSTYELVQHPSLPIRKLIMRKNLEKQRAWKRKGVTQIDRWL